MKSVYNIFNLYPYNKPCICSGTISSKYFLQLLTRYSKQPCSFCFLCLLYIRFFLSYFLLYLISTSVYFKVSASSDKLSIYFPSYQSNVLSFWTFYLPLTFTKVYFGYLSVQVSNTPCNSSILYKSSTKHTR